MYLETRQSDDFIPPKVGTRWGHAPDDHMGHRPAGPDLLDARGDRKPLEIRKHAFSRGYDMEDRGYRIRV